MKHHPMLGCLHNYRHSRVACPVLRYGGERFSGRNVHQEGPASVSKAERVV